MKTFTRRNLTFMLVLLFNCLSVMENKLTAQTNTFTAGACIGGTGADYRFYHPLIANFDGSAGLDIIVVNEASTVRLFKNNGSNGFDGGTNILTSAFGPMSAGDLDGDGDLDFVHSNGRVYLNNGSGTFTQYGSGSVFTASGGVGAVKIADFNGDGKQDIAFMNSSYNAGDYNQIWLNTGTTGSPAFTLADTWDNVALGPRTFVTVGDIDGDGDLDLVNGAGSWAGGVYKNNGNGDFSHHQTINSYNGKIWLLDWDGDGDLDYVVNDGYNSVGLRLRKNDGTGTFQTAQTTLYAPLSVTDIEVADLNADGAYDFVVPAYSGATYYLSSGCSFTLAGQTLSNSRYVQLADFNGDGKLDVFCTARDVASCLWFNDLNPGSTHNAFTGSGNWNNGMNWSRGATPPLTIPCGNTIVIDGSGTATLNVNQTFAADSRLTVSANKTLEIAGGLTLTNNGIMTNDGTLKGTGALVQNGTFTNSSTGIIAPGASPGTLTVTGNLNLGSGAYHCDINGTGQGTTYDLLAVSGLATLTNAQLVIDWGSFTPAAGQVFDVMTFGSRAGMFSSVTIPPVAGTSFVVSYTNNKVTVAAASALPVKLVGFEAKPEGSAVRLGWRTESEANNQGFEIQHSTDGRNWQILGFVNGKGAAPEKNDYTFVHDNPPAATNYYRLRQMDFDGGYEFSKTIVCFAGSEGRPRIFPAVVEGRAHIENPGGGPLQVMVFNVTGRLVMTARDTNQLDFSNLKAGMYFVQLRTPAATITEKILKK